MMRRVCLLILTIVVLVAPAAQLHADESEDGTIEVITAALGEVLALGDLCGWNFAAKVDKLYQDSKKALNLTTAQEKVIRAKVATARRCHIRTLVRRWAIARSGRRLQGRAAYAA